MSIVLDEPLDPSQPHPPSESDLLWWLGKRTEDIQKCLVRLASGTEDAEWTEKLRLYLADRIEDLNESLLMYQDCVKLNEGPLTPLVFEDIEAGNGADDAQEDGA
jgi:hypothetical protein